MLKAEGAHALYIEGLSIRTETVAAARGHRPWVPDAPSSQRRAVTPDRPTPAMKPTKSFDGNPED